MTSTALLTLGRMPKGLVLVHGFAALGWRVIVAEPFAWHLCRTSRHVDASFKVRAPVDDQAGYLDDMREIIRRENVDLVLPVSEEVLHVAELAGTLPPSVRLFLAEKAMLHRLYDKHAFVKMAAGYGLAVPETHVLGSEAGADLASRCDTIVKFSRSCSGLGLQRVARGDALPMATARAAVVQEALQGQEYSTFSVVDAGRVIGTAIYRGTVFDGSVAVAFARVTDQPAIHRWIDGFARQSGVSGFLSFDFIVDADGVPQAIECNPRMTSGAHFLDPESLARAIADPANATGIAAGPHDHMQQVLPCLTQTEGTFLRGGDWRPKFRELRRSRDVTWSTHDPLPLPLMTFSSWEILYKSIRQRISFGDAATRDIVWHDEH